MQRIAIAVGTASVLVIFRYRIYQRLSRVLVAACDLDKTMYPPKGPNQERQLKANVDAMFRFESLGGFVFPVTGNNPPQAQVKFGSLRRVDKHPGIFCNGGLVLGPHGIEIERHALGQLQVHAVGTDFVTALLDFWQEERNLVEGVGLLFFLPEELAGYTNAYDNVDAFCLSQRVTPAKRSREELIADRERVLQIVCLFPPLTSDAAYATECHPWQQRVVCAIQDRGLSKCESSHGFSGIKFTPMKDPWPELDLCVGGVDKGSALTRFLQSPAVCDYLGVRSVEPALHVAVFGDAANDVPMFRSIDGKAPALRVAMPHASHAELTSLANIRAEVSEVLQRCCDARALIHPCSSLRAAGMGWLQIVAARCRALCDRGGWTACLELLLSR